MPHGSSTPNNSSKLNPHGDSNISPNKYSSSNKEYQNLLSTNNIVQIGDPLSDSDLVSLSEQQLNKNVLWKPTNEYDLSTNEQLTPPLMQNVAGRVGLGNLVSFENSIMGRFVGLGPQTPMIQIANSRLILEFTRRVGDQLAKNLLPTINLGGFILGKVGLGKKEPLLRPAQEFIITKLPSGERDTAYYVGLFTGFESNKNPLDGVSDNKTFLDFTGEGQKQLLRQNLEKNIFRTSDIDPTTTGGFLGKIVDKINRFLAPKDTAQQTEPTLEYNYDPKNYDGSDSKPGGRIMDVQYQGLGKTLPPEQELGPVLGFPSEKDVDTFFTDELGWEVNRSGKGNKRGLLRFTQNIVDSGHAVGRRIDTSTGGNKENIITEPFIGKNGEPIAKGRNLKSGTPNTFCRSWVKPDQYDSYKKAIRSSNHYLKRDGNLSSLNINSVLDNVGMPRFHPVLNDDDSLKPMMFSIENLAWDVDDIIALPKCEQGPEKGRIMWFPPYEIEIDENISANWEKTDFIGRGEPVYTYINSERTLNFQFKLIMDYPSNLRSNINDGESDNFFAGCDELSEGQKQPLSEEEINELNVKKGELSSQLDQDPVNINLKYNGKGDKLSNAIKFHFAHSDNVDQSYDTGYESDSGKLNENTELELTELVSFLNDDLNSKYFDLTIVGHTSNPTNKDVTDFNKTLSLNRSKSIKSHIETFLNLIESGSEDSNINSVSVKGEGSTGTEVTEEQTQEQKDSLSQKESRRVDVFVVPNFDSHEETQPVPLDPDQKKEITDQMDDIDKQLQEQRVGDFIGGECQYFKELKEDDPFIFKTYKDKIDFFHPSFHSQTPEDFSKRLVFLQQCTRQGKPFPGGEVSNSVFGRMPVCVLRIGDFFNCRIVINNIGFSYEPLLWDLNPEGSGVQPMICNVNVNCNIIGGADLEGPVTQLQNAISSKFYANHDDRVDLELEELREQENTT